MSSETGKTKLEQAEQLVLGLADHHHTNSVVALTVEALRELEQRVASLERKLRRVQRSASRRER